MTGGSGLLGKEFVRILEDSGEQIILLQRSQSSNDSSSVSSKRIDFCETWDEDCIPNDTEVIVHLAQSEHHNDFPGSAKGLFKVNIESTFKLLERAREIGVKKFIYASSGGVENALKHSWPLNPGAANSPSNFYLSTKAVSELMAQNYTAFFDVIIARFFFIYGEGQRQEMLVPKLTHRILNGEKIQINKNGTWINPIHVSDAAKLLEATLYTKGSQQFEIGGKEKTTVEHLCNQISEILGKSSNLEQIDRKEEQLLSKSEFTYSILGYPSVSLREGLHKYAAPLRQPLV